MHTRIAFTFISVSLVAALAAPANAQYIARKLQRESHLVTASGISGDRVVGSYGAQYGVRNRYDGVVWGTANGVPSYEMDGATSFLDVNSDWVIENGEGWSIYSGYSPHVARNLVTGVSYSLGYGAWSQSSGHSAVTTGIRGDWAWGNQTHYAMGPRAYYYIYGSNLVNLPTGETRNYSWDNGAYSYYQRQFVDVSDGKVLERTYGSYSLIDIESGVRTPLTLPISAVGMSGTQIAGNSASGAALHDYTNGQTVTLSKSGMSNTMMKQNALRWDNTTGAMTNLQNFLGGTYTASAVINLDKANANGAILVSADRAGGTDFIALRQFTGTVVGVGEGEIATFEEDHEQTGGVVVNEGTIQWTNPPRWWNLQKGLLTGTGNFYGNINNTGGGTLSGGGAGGGTGDAADLARVGRRAGLPPDPDVRGCAVAAATFGVGGRTWERRFWWSRPSLRTSPSFEASSRTRTRSAWSLRRRRSPGSIGSRTQRTTRAPRPSRRPRMSPMPPPATHACRSIPRARTPMRRKT
ncbi:MAG: hypothetical protein H7145_22530 [Akkermansiaceae bacterium]|nr:hypothetical protein [Armatimonadota bacterium]